MFEHHQLQHVIGLQDRAYRFIWWATRLDRAGQTRPTPGRHAAMGIADAAADWLRAHGDSVPLDIRPAEMDVPKFASLVAAFVKTSFEPLKRPADGRCDCGFCALLGSKGVRLLNPDARDRQTAHALKMLAVETIAEDLGLALLRNEIDALISDAGAPAEEIAWIAYAQELLRRSEFSSQGAGVLHLWRQIAHEHSLWRGPAPVKKGFALTAERVILAQQRVAAFVTDWAARVESTGQSVGETELRQRAESLRAEIKSAFAGVSRAGGVSWSESDVIDGGFSTREVRDEARAQDRDTSWEQVLNDPDWRPDCCVGGGSFSFLDSIGARYYLPTAMCWTLVRPAETGQLVVQFEHGQFTDLTEPQMRCCAKYIELIRDRARSYEVSSGTDWESTQWQRLLADGWNAHLGGNNPDQQAPAEPSARRPRTTCAAPATPERLAAQRQTALHAIYNAFKGVSRAGGVSWTQAVVIDNVGDGKTMEQALSEDRDNSWESLVEDASWTPTVGVGGFAFLDPIGTRYYLPAAMVRVIADKTQGFLDALLRRIDDERLISLDSAQLAATAEFIKFMHDQERLEGDDDSEWARLLKRGWSKHCVHPDS